MASSEAWAEDVADQTLARTLVLRAGHARRVQVEAIALSIFGQVGNAGQGDFFEGVMTAGYSTDAADDAVQANVVAVYSQ